MGMVKCQLSFKFQFIFASVANFFVLIKGHVMVQSLFRGFSSVDARIISYCGKCPKRCGRLAKSYLINKAVKSCSIISSPLANNLTYIGLVHVSYVMFPTKNARKLVFDSTEDWFKFSILRSNIDVQQTRLNVQDRRNRKR